jgi:acetyl esterase/lipase
LAKKERHEGALEVFGPTHKGDAGAMGAADVAVTLEIWPRMIHAWALWNARLEDGRKALERAGEFMRR